MNDEQDQPLEVMPPSAIHALERAQIDTQVATAHQYPRSLEQFKKRALSMATLDSETAESCIYCRPVGKEFDKETGRWKEKFAEGPSIRLAEIVAVSYGNLRAASRVVEQTPRFVRCEGVAHDLESNTAMKSECVESTVKTDGTPYSERQRALTAKVALAKALRDAVFKVVPRALCKPITDAAKKVGAGMDKPLEERRKKAQAWVSTLRISEDRVFAVLGVSGWTDVTADHLITLTGLKTGLADGDHIDEVFPKIEPAGKSPEMPGPKAPAKGAKTPQEAPKAETPPNTPPAPENAPSGAAVSENQPSGGVPDQPRTSDEAAEAAAGLAPEPGPAKEPDPKLIDKDSDTASVKTVKALCRVNNISADMLMAWCRSNKLAKEGQQLGDLSTSKLESLASRWDTIVSRIKA